MVKNSFSKLSDCRPKRWLEARIIGRLPQSGKEAKIRFLTVWGLTK